MQNNDDIQSHLLRFGLDIGFMISGFFGALLLAAKNKKKKLKTSLACLVAGTMSANYLTPIILNFAPDSIKTNGKYAVAFMMGYMGLKGLENIMDIFTDYLNSRKNNNKDLD